MQNRSIKKLQELNKKEIMEWNWMNVRGRECEKLKGWMWGDQSQYPCWFSSLLWHFLTLPQLVLCVTQKCQGGYSASACIFKHLTKLTLFHSLALLICCTWHWATLCASLSTLEIHFHTLISEAKSASVRQSVQCPLFPCLLPPLKRPPSLL